MFALHPAHVESVAWLAGRKDVLALFFVGAALALYAGTWRHRRLVVPLLLLLACLSKGVAVAAPLLLPMHDLLRKRRIDAPVLLASLACALGVMAIDVHVGRTVHMTTAPLGGSRLATMATMGPVFARYLGHVVWPPSSSVVLDVPVRAATDLLAWLGYLPLALWAAFGASAWRADRRPALALGLFLVPMAPTSQVLFPLQNVMADRYLLLPLLGPALVAGLLAERYAHALLGKGAVALGLAGLFAGTASRANTFADSVTLFRDAEAKTTASAIPSYQLAAAYEARGELALAETAYREAIAREPQSDTGRSAANNLSLLCSRQGRIAEATAILVTAVDRFPNDPKVLGNLAEITARHGDPNVARGLFELLLRRFPDYEVGRRNFELHFGEAAPKREGESAP